MITAKERERQFRENLMDVIKKHGAQMVITDDGKPYGMQSGVVVITMCAKWDDDGNQISEYTEFNL